MLSLYVGNEAMAALKECALAKIARCGKLLLGLPAPTTTYQSLTKRTRANGLPFASMAKTT